MKKVSFLFIAVFAMLSFSYSQVTSIIGKWKPVKCEIEGFMIADAKTKKSEFVKPIEELVKGDKNQTQSTQMLEMMKSMLLEKMQTTTEEYQANGNYFEFNSTGKGNPEPQKYTYDSKLKVITLVNKETSENEKISVEYTKTGFIGTVEMTSFIDPTKKMKLKMTYEKAY